MADQGLGDSGCIWIWEFAGTGDVSGMEQLLADGEDIDATDDDGRTALMVAVRDDAVEIATWLLDRGAAVEARDNEGKTALMLAAQLSQTNSVELLLDRGANAEEVDVEENSTALDFATHALQASMQWHDAAIANAGEDVSEESRAVVRARTCVQVLTHAERFQRWYRRRLLATWRH